VGALGVLATSCAGALTLPASRNHGGSEIPEVPFAVVNKHRVIVDAKTRKIVKVYK